MIFLRSLVFALAQILLTPPYAIVALATFLCRGFRAIASSRDGRTR